MKINILAYALLGGLLCGAAGGHEEEVGQDAEQQSRHQFWNKFQQASEKSALTNNQRQGKVFSVFSIVSFPNEACISTRDKSNGTCLSPADCKTVAGVAEGTCAAGFGICCIRRFDSCGGVISSNTTVIQNPGYPNTYSKEGTCSYLITRQDESICQVRLDFEAGTFSYASSGTTGCVSGTTDYISFTLKNGVTYSAVCGELTGQHMYYEVGSSGDSVQLDISLTGTTDDRSWNILVSQIACTDPWRAPDDCLQYHTGNSGGFKSFNFDNGQVLSSQNYRICIRQEIDFCSIAYSPVIVSSSSSDPDSFELPTSTTGGTTTTTNCKQAYIGIPIGGDTGTGDSQANRYCGSYFDSQEGSTRNGMVTAAVAPFEVYFFSDSAKTDKSGDTGFNINYRQKLCSSV